MRNLKDFPDAEPIFIDANIFLHHAFDTLPGASDFLAKVESQGIRAYTSTLVLEEVMYILFIQALGVIRKTADSADLAKMLHNLAARKAAADSVRKYFDYLGVLKVCGLRILNLIEVDLSKGLAIVGDSGLMTADACHAAVMERKGIRHIATADRDFLRLAGFTVWMP